MLAWKSSFFGCKDCWHQSYRSSCYSSYSKGFLKIWSQLVAIGTECLPTMSAWKSSFFLGKGCWYQFFHHLVSVHVLKVFQQRGLNLLLSEHYMQTMQTMSAWKSSFCRQGLLTPILSSTVYSSCSKGFSTPWSQLIAIRTECLLTISAWKSSFYVCFLYKYIHHLLTASSYSNLVWMTPKLSP